MELTKKAGGQPENLVTNGLLTVELVSGQLQVGDTQFLQHSPATNPVAGDQVGNSLATTYASFNQGKLAFGVPGATQAGDRIGQAVNEAVSGNGQVSVLATTPISLKYARYFGETGHNVADVFNNFFQADPLDESKWLSVMGYPITEAFWAKDKVVVGGQQRDVLIQLFQRRILTYTPSNSAAFQVEMGNIGQHYYVWRYNFDSRDVLPGNYRLLAARNKTLKSVDIRNPANLTSLGNTPNGGVISGLWPLNEGRAVISTQNYDKIYLVDLTGSRAFKALPVPDSLIYLGRYPQVLQAVGSADGKRIFVLFAGETPTSRGFVMVYETDTLAGDNLNITGYRMELDNLPYLQNEPNRLSVSGLLEISLDGHYMAIYEGQHTYTSPGDAPGKLHIYDLKTHTDQQISFNAQVWSVSYFWLNPSNQLLLTVLPRNDTNKNSIPGIIYSLDPSTGQLTQLLQAMDILQVLPTPDTNYFALLHNNNPVLNNYEQAQITLRSLANPDIDIGKPYNVKTPGTKSSAPIMENWSVDGTYLSIRTFTEDNEDSKDHFQINMVSLLSGEAIIKNQVTSEFYSWVSLAGSHYIRSSMNQPNNDDKTFTQTMSIRNLDGSEKNVLILQKVAFDDFYYQYSWDAVVQVPVSS